MANISHPGETQDISDMSRDEWLRNQKTKLGGSDIPAVMGCGFKSRYTLWANKISDDTDEEMSDPAFLGLAEENSIAKHLEWKYDVTVQRDHVVRYHKDLPFLGVNLDRVILSNDKFGDGKPGVQQIKTTGKKKIKDWKKKGWEVPKPYILQTLTEMDVMGVSYGMVSIKVTGDFNERFLIHHYLERSRYQDLIDVIHREVEEFWTFVRGGTPPPLKTEEDINDYYSSGSEGKAVTATVSFMDELRATNSPEEVKVAAKRYMGDAELLLSPEGKRLATWKTHKRSTFDKEGLEREYPKIFEEFSSKKEYRQFLWK